MLKKTWISLGILLLIIIIITFFYFNSYKSQIEGRVILTEEIAPEIEEVPEPTPEPEPVPQKRFDIIAKRFEFIPETITVNKGDNVTLTITSTDVTHGLAIGEFFVNERLEPGKTVTTQFIANRKGEFEIICNVPCGSGHGSMRGMLIVN
jgi:cytochrome c oxidase subunit 2